MKQYTFLLLAVFMIALLAGCVATAPEPAVSIEEGASLRATVTEADPQSAVDEIYATLPDSRVTKLTDFSLRETLPDTADYIDEFYGCISNPNGGLADIIILKPRDKNRDSIREALRLYQQKRMQEFENYDILNALSIAGNAEVFDQGDYVVLLMLPDNEAAREIIDLHMPL